MLLTCKGVDGKMMVICNILAQFIWQFEIKEVILRAIMKVISKIRYNHE